MHRVVVAITAIEWRVLLPSLGVAIAVPMDLILRFLIPIASGVVWVFLKPIIIKRRDRYQKGDWREWFRSLLKWFKSLPKFFKKKK